MADPDLSRLRDVARNAARYDSDVTLAAWELRALLDAASESATLRAELEAKKLECLEWVRRETNAQSENATLRAQVAELETLRSAVEHALPLSSDGREVICRSGIAQVHVTLRALKASRDEE